MGGDSKLLPSAMLGCFSHPSPPSRDPFDEIFENYSSASSVAQLVCGLLTEMFSSIQASVTMEIPGSIPGRRTLCAVVRTGKSGRGPRDLANRVHFELSALCT
jgi:hypothetical protein